MIYVLELCAPRKPLVWFAYDEDDLARKLAAGDPLAALHARGGEHCIYWNDQDAIGAFEGADPRIAGPDHWHARRAMYEQLVALEVLADDN